MSIKTRTKCEVYSRRICGYIRPIEQWNDGKKQEFHDRVTFQLNSIGGKENELAFT